MSDSDCSTVINQSPVDVEKVTVWYRCNICSCYLFSIPALERHSRTAHNVHNVELTDDPPPGALEGKIYYTYDTKYNQVPKPKPYSFQPMKGWTHDELIEKLETKASSVRKLFQTLPDVSPSDRDFPIRVKKLEDLLESSGDENENEPPDQEKNSSNPSALDSPPDSGIHGSECHDDERQQPVAAVVPVAKPNAVSNQVNETSCNNGDSDTQVPSKSSGVNKVTNVEDPPKRKLPCTLCHKKFNNVSSLNFHTKKFHPGCDPEKATTQDKVILTIQRDGTGNFSSKPGSKIKSPESHTEVDDNDNRKRQQIRTRKRSITSDISKITSTTSQSKQSEPPQTRLRRSRENSQTGQKKQRKSSYYDDSEYQQPGSASHNWRKFVVSDREESENQSVSDVSKSTSPAAKKKVVGRKKTRQTDIPDSPKNTRTRSRSRIISRSRSRSENESSSSETSDPEKSDSGGESDNAEELTEKSTTSEESLSPPSLTDYGSDDDLFTPVITKRKKQKVPKEKQDCEKKREIATKPAKRSAPRAASDVSSIDSEPESEVSSKKSNVSSGKKDSAKKCTLCSMEYKDASAFIQHLYKAHKGKEMFFTCGLCNKRFSTMQDISIFNKHIIDEREALMEKEKQKKIIRRADR